LPLDVRKWLCPSVKAVINSWGFAPDVEHGPQTRRPVCGGKAAASQQRQSRADLVTFTLDSGRREDDRRQKRYLKLSFGNWHNRITDKRLMIVGGGLIRFLCATSAPSVSLW
jgi:hypothetical protein